MVDSQINGLVTRRTQECPKTFSGDISPGSILVRYWYTWDVPRNKIISTWQLHRRSSRHCLIGLRNVSRRSQEGLFGSFHPGSDPGTAWDAPGRHSGRNKSTHKVQNVTSSSTVCGLPGVAPGLNPSIDLRRSPKTILHLERSWVKADPPLRYDPEKLWKFHLLPFCWDFYL